MELNSLISQDLVQNNVSYILRMNRWLCLYLQKEKIYQLQQKLEAISLVQIISTTAYYVGMTIINFLSNLVWIMEEVGLKETYILIFLLNFCFSGAIYMYRKFFSHIFIFSKKIFQKKKIGKVFIIYETF